MERITSLTDQLYAMKPGDTRVFEASRRPTVSRLIQRVKGEDRKYVCRSTPDGYQVWRTQ